MDKYKKNPLFGFVYDFRDLRSDIKIKVAGRISKIAQFGFLDSVTDIKELNLR